MAVVPRLLRRGAEIVNPAIGQLFGRVVHPGVLLVGHQVVVDRRLQEIPGDIALVIAAVGRIPVLEATGIDDVSASAHSGQREGSLQVSIGLLRGQNLGNPVLKSRLHFLVCLDDIRIALRIDHERNAHGLHGLVNPGVGEDVGLVSAVRLAAQGLGGFHEVIDAAGTLREVGAIDLIDAMRNPTHHE